MLNYFRNQQIKKHIEKLQKSKEGKPSCTRFEIAKEIDYWNDVLKNKKPYEHSKLPKKND